jgi:ABC-2 type transport system permease protein
MRNRSEVYQIVTAYIGGHFSSPDRQEASRLKTILHLIRKDYRLFWNDRLAVSLTFIVPVILIVVWGAVFSGLDSGPEKLRLAFLNNSTSPIAKQIESTLDTMRTFTLIRSYKNDRGTAIPFDTNSIKDYVRKGSIPAALVLPSDLFTDTSSGIKVKYYYDPKNSMEIQLYDGMIRQVIYRQLPGVFNQAMRQQANQYLGNNNGNAFNGAIDSLVKKYFDATTVTGKQENYTPRQDSLARARGQAEFFGNMVRLESEQLVGTEIVNPWATRSVGGWAIMFLLFTLTASASSLFEEKNGGVTLRLLASPVSRLHILWSKYLFNMSLGFIQLCVLFTFGAVLYRIDIVSNIFNLIVVVVAASTACAAFGMLLASISRTAAQANGLGTLLILTMSSVGGAWFPTTFMPAYVQMFSKLTPVYWSMDGFMKVLWRHATIMEILPNVGILLLTAFLITLVSVWQFKKGRVF